MRSWKSRGWIRLAVGLIALIAVAVIVFAAIAIYLLTRGPEASPYRAVPVSHASIVKEIRVTASVDLTDQVEVPAPIEGQLVEVAVQPGDEVEKGQLLARLDKVSAELAYLVAQAESQVARARVSEAEASVATCEPITRAHESSRREGPGEREQPRSGAIRR